MPEAASAGAAAPDPIVVTVPGWAQQLLDAGVDEAVVMAAVAKDAQDAQGPPPSPEQRAQAAEAMRAQAEEDLSHSLASAQQTRAHGESLLEAAEAQLAKAQADYDQAMATADEIDPAPPWEPAAGPAEGSA